MTDSTTAGTIPAFDPTSPAFFVRPDHYEVLAALRAHSPVHPVGPGLWTVARHRDIHDIGRDPTRFCSGRGALVNDPLRTGSPTTAAPSILHMDPPQHAGFRSTVNRSFTPRALAGLEAAIALRAAEVLDAAPRDVEIDAVDHLSAPFPITVICDLLGVPETDRPDFRRWSDATIEAPDRPDEAGTGLGELAGYVSGLIADKRRWPGEDLISTLCSARVEDRALTDDELFIFVLTLLVAGNETTRTLLSGSMQVLAAHPDQRGALAADPGLTNGAVEECLRWVTPVHAFCRTATEPVVVNDQALAAGDYVILLYASGNRDEQVFGPDADRFDLSRPMLPLHVAFGFGEHVCLGATLARMEARLFLRALLDRYPTYEVTGPAVPVASTTVAGVASLPTVLAP